MLLLLTPLPLTLLLPMLPLLMLLPPTLLPLMLPPAETPPAGGDNAVVPGNGVVGEDGSCICMVSCSAGSFPNADVQGLNAWGGIAGSIPIQLESIN